MFMTYGFKSRLAHHAKRPIGISDGSFILQKTGKNDEGSEYIEKAYAILNAIEDTKLIGELEKELSYELEVRSKGPLQLEISQQE